MRAKQPTILAAPLFDYVKDKTKPSNVLTSMG